LPAKVHPTSIVVGTCSTCHNGTNATGKSTLHVATTAQCDTCHKSTTIWTGTKLDHTTLTNCSSCHNGTSATGKATTHVPTTVQCSTCHKPGYPNWLPAKVHPNATVTATCSTCHNGSFATGKTANHIPTTAQCDSCHKAGFVTWNPGRFHINVTVVTGCASCHATNIYGLTAKPNTPNHVGVTVCETCHKSTTNWLTVTFAHSAANAVGTGTCDTCHNGTTATGKTAAHIPVPAGVAKCDACHKSQVNFNTSVTMSHTSVTTATCKSCHNGTYISQGNNGGAMAKVANHIPEAVLPGGAAMDCSACHTVTTVWTTIKMNHLSMPGGTSNGCVTCHVTGSAYLGNMLKKALAHDKPGKPDCSTSGCHKPLGNIGTSWSKWN
jgi:hypothetical protein